MNGTNKFNTPLDIQGSTISILPGVSVTLPTGSPILIKYTQQGQSDFSDAMSHIKPLAEQSLQTQYGIEHMVREIDRSYSDYLSPK